MEKTKTKKYKIIYADPPWNYNTRGYKTDNRTIRHYDRMSEQDLHNLHIQDIADDNSVLFLWITGSWLAGGLKLIEAWGFTYKTMGFTWVKKNKKADSLFFGMGYWTRTNAEFCLLATRGKLRRINASVPSTIVSRIEQHSKKPDIIRDNIVKLMGDLPRVELFARQKTEGWDVWGNEVNSDLEIKYGK